MNLGGVNAAVKKQQMVDRMVLRFESIKSEEDNNADAENEKIIGQGEGTNRVGRYTLDVTCRKEDGSWELELTRIYTPLAPTIPGPSEQQPSRKSRASQDSLLAPAATGPRKPRAAAPLKGTYAAQKIEKSTEDNPPAKKKAKIADSSKRAKKEDSQPCYLIIFGQIPTEEDNQIQNQEKKKQYLPSDIPPSTAFRCSSVIEAQDKMQGLIPEIEGLIRVPSDQGDGVLFPPSDSLHLTLNPTLLKTLGGPPPILPTKCNHLIIFDVDATAAKARSWRASVAAFATAARAARHALHVYRTCGQKLKSLEWLTFDHLDATESKPRARIFSDGTFDTQLPIAELAALELAATN